MSDVIRCEVEDRIAVVTIDNPPVNALSHAVRSGVRDAVAAAAADDGVDAIVLIGAGRTFPAGADIREFDQPTKDPHTLAVVDFLDTVEKPLVAAIHGTALGGGLELTLGCHFRVAAPGARVGLPEVKIGVFPGAAGIQRLPRIAGLDNAMSLFVLGDPVGAVKAKEMGIVDEIVEGDLRAGAVAFAKRVAAEGRPLRRACEPVEGIGSPEEFKETIEKYRDIANRRMRGHEAPHHAIDAAVNGLTVPYPQAVKDDRALFEQVKDSDQARALRYAFFAEREAAKLPDIGKDVAPRDIASAGVIGAGTMGRGIAMSLADAGLPVIMVEAEQDALDRGLAAIEESYAAMVARGRLSEQAKAERVSRISGALDYSALGEADLVIEAAFEDLQVKKDIFAKLDGVAKPGALLATNTSYMDIDAIASATGRPADVIGLHYFVPANVMRLLEVVRPEKAAPDAVATGMAVAKRTGKVGVLANKVCHGFIANRSRLPMVREASFLVEEGATPEQVDRVISGLGMPMGPLAVGDLSGLDVSWRMRLSLADARDPEARHMHLADRLCEMGRYGRKAGQGWYRYEDGRTPVADPEVEAIAAEVAKEQGIERRSVSDREILERCLYAAINEGAKILEEGVALRASDIDVMWLYGFGWPRWRGGIMFHADRIGLAEIAARVREFHARHGKLWQPSALLERLADEGGSFTGR